MMKLTGTVSLAAGVVLVLPAWTQSETAVQSLQRALSKTHAALETFTGFLMQIENGDPSGVDAVRTFTESPIEDERRRDELSHELRLDINRLQMNLDYLEGLGIPETVVQPMGAPVAGLQPDEEIHSALDNVTVETLSAVQAPSLEPEAAVNPLSASPEADDYSAAPLAHARACYRAGQFEKCLALVEALDENAETLFWRGRALEQLDRTEEAIEAYTLASSTEGPERYPQRATDRLEFLTWKKDFMRTIVTRPAEGGDE